MSILSSDNLIQQLRRVLKDAIDYLQSVVTLLQVRLTELALSSVVFVCLIFAALFLGVLSFMMFNIALGVWLAYVTQSAGWAILILGAFYGVLAALSGTVAMRWLKKIQS